VNAATAGSPKRRNSYGDRVIIVPAKKYGTGNTVRSQGRVTASFISGQRHYSTGRATTLKANIVTKLDNLYIRSKTNPNVPIDRDVYKILCDVDLLKLAYENLKSKSGQMTPGITPETLDGMSIEVLKRITKSIRTEQFKFKAGRRIQIEKPSGGTIPITIASPRDKLGDKLVQEAIRLILEAIYEPIFLENSHGFRPQKSCNTALKYISQKFQASS
jgi:retron-type reverse transcriptase